ncbi:MULTISPECIES: hypothetical protein [Vibrio harveyi group]|uniref:Pycsar effector protein domain-containing protein n=1 Tax=Vibrio parahaemolyticus TaxID=670 RepID=A0AA46UMT4_VIBPH|nr:MULTISPECIES: hypothetical protein [Vibrio harveyi group]MCC3848993.1 hypothetical protein [Vibrio parahaemolyticus]UYV28622.1 hypothetical protein M5598_23250 [Vibrio parahaemolyticus]HCJ4875903.1 hypothetical protein [Vibrio parahaemolyticus]
MDKGDNLVEAKLAVLMESLRRTDSYIIAADQKASFTLAAGVTFLGIFCSILYGVLSNEGIDLPVELTLSVLLSSLLVWLVWFYKIRCIFLPKVPPSKRKSLVSFASATSTHSSLTQYFDTYADCYELGSKKLRLTQLELDILENHWICSQICMQKMQLFKESLVWLFISLAVSTTGLAYIALYLSMF